MYNKNYLHSQVVKDSFVKIRPKDPMFEKETFNVILCPAGDMVMVASEIGLSKRLGLIKDLWVYKMI